MYCSDAFLVEPEGRAFKDSSFLLVFRVGIFLANTMAEPAPEHEPPGSNTKAGCVGEVKND